MLFKQINQNPFPGEGNQQGAIIPWYAAQYTQNPVSAGLRPANELCETWPEIGFGNSFESVFLDAVDPENPAIISAGALLTPSLPGTDTVAASLTDASSTLVYGITLTTGGLTPNAEIGNFLFMEDLGITRLIKANTATNVIFSLKGTIFGNNVLDPDAVPAGPGNGTNVSIIRPGHVSVNATPSVPVGVLVNDQTEGFRTVQQVRGLAFIIGNNSGTALVAGTPAVTAANGIIEGGTAPSATMGDAFILPLASYDGPNIRIPCYFKGAGF